jgi:C-terminal processing protease CtpA/Prc
MKSRSPIPVLCALMILLETATFSIAQKPSAYDRQRAETMLIQIKSDIKDNYYDKNFHGVDLDATFKAAAEKMKAAQSNGQLLGIIAQAVLELNDSHTNFAPPDRKTNTDYGFELQMIGDQAFVTRVKDKSDAAAKGLKVGDAVYLIDGYQLARSNLWKLVYLYYILRPQPGMRLTVGSPGGEPREIDALAKVTDRKRINLTSYSDYMDLVREDENYEEDRKKSHRTQELGDVIVWKMPEFNLTEEEVDSMMSKVSKYKTLVLDLRGNPGGYELTLLRMIGNSFDRDVKIGEIQRRKDVKPFLAKTRGANAFKGKIIALIDSRSASSAEIYARTLQLEKRGIVVGDHSAGAVMRSRFHQRTVGLETITIYGVSITDADVKMSDGATLEGKGVAPDTLSLPTGSDLASKRDPVLAASLGLAGVEIDAEKAGALFPELKKP